jgi:hypothetical protein
VFVGYVNGCAVFKNNTINPPILFSPEDSSFYMSNVEDLVKISDYYIIRQIMIGEKKYQISIYNKSIKKIKTIFTNDKLYPWEIDVDSTLTYISYSRTSNGINEIVVENIKNQSQFVIKGFFPKIIKNRLFYLNYRNEGSSTDVSATIYSLNLKNLSKEIILDNVYIDDTRIYNSEYIIFARYVRGNNIFFLYNIKNKQQKIINRELEPLFSYYSYKKNKIIFYNYEGKQLKIFAIDP